MKIAIQGHPTRGKEVIQILESLGGINTSYLNGNSTIAYYYIDYNRNNLIRCNDYQYVNKYCKKYTLEEFEKEFPFKIGDEVVFPVTKGWLSGKITGIKDFEYEVDTRIGSYRYVEPHQLSLYPMKEERNITLTLDKAKEWYQKGGDLKEVALQAYSEEELKSPPRSWEEFATNHARMGYYISADGKPLMCASSGKLSSPHVCPSKKSAEAHLAMIQLEQLRDCWRQSWVPSKGDGGFGIRFDFYEGFRIVRLYSFSAFLSFPTYEMAKEFLECFRDLIEKAGDLI